MDCDISEISLRLTFEPNTDNPSRLFRSMAKSIDALNTLDSFLASSIGGEYHTEIQLVDIEKGSIFTYLKSKLKKFVMGDANLNGEVSENSATEFITRSRDIGVELVASRKFTIDDVKESLESIDAIAKAIGIKDRIGYCEPDILRYSEILNSLNDSTKELTNDSEQLEFKEKSNDKAKLVLTNNESQICLKDIEDSITDSEVVANSDLKLKVKRPDYLGDSKWDFKHKTKDGEKLLSAKILDKEWLKKFKTGEIVIPAGDSIFATVRSTQKMDKYSRIISVNHEVLKIKSVEK